MYIHALENGLNALFLKLIKHKCMLVCLFRIELDEFCQND